MIRKAKLEDCDNIRFLLHLVGFSISLELLAEKIRTILSESSSDIFVAQNEEGKITGVITINYIQQIMLADNFARISCLVVEPSYHNLGIKEKLESYCVVEARKRQCNRIEVHCHVPRSSEHRFYFEQGYTASPVYLRKSFV